MKAQAALRRYGHHIDPLFSRVLVGIDGSPSGDEAVRQALRLAELTEADAEVAYVGQPGRSFVPPFTVAGDLARAQDALGRAVGAAEGISVTVTRELLAGDPERVLLREAEERFADLLCLGHEAATFRMPRGGLQALRVAREASCSVLVAKATPWAQGRPFPGSIVAAVDGSAGASQAARAAGRLAALAGASLHLVHVVPTHRSGDLGWIPAGEPPLGTLDPIVDLVRETGVEPGGELVLGQPGPALAEAAQRQEADLLVVGSRGLQGLLRVVLGSVSAWLVRHAPWSVLVSRPRAR